MAILDLSSNLHALRALGGSPFFFENRNALNGKIQNGRDARAT